MKVNRIKRLGYVLLVLVLSLSLLSGCDKEEEVVKETELTVNTVKVEKRNITQAVKYPGTVRGVNEVHIMPKAPARVTAIYVKPGDQVSAGQTLLTLDSSDYEAAIRQAEAGVAGVEANKRQHDIQLENARLNYERIEKLFDAGAASQRELEAAESGVKLLETGNIEAALEQAQAGLMMAQTQLSHCTVTSPISGVVGSINLSLGDTANPTSPAATVSDTSRLEIETLVSESEISYIKPGTVVDVLVKAAGEKPFKGQVDSVSGVPDPMRRNYTVKVVLDNPGNKIKSGMFAEVVISTISKNDVLAVSVDAVIPRGGRQIVYTVDSKNRAREAEVKTGLRDNKYVEIVSGLKAGEQVITKGNTLVNNGTLVRVVSGGAK